MMSQEINETQNNGKNKNLECPSDCSSESTSQQLLSDAQISNAGVGGITQSERDQIRNAESNLPLLEVWDDELAEKSTEQPPGARDFIPEKDREKAVDNLVDELIKCGDSLGKTDEQREKLAHCVSDALNFKQSDEAVQDVVDEINKKLKEQGSDFCLALCNPEYASGVTGGFGRGTLWIGANYQLDLLNKDGKVADTMQVFNMRGMQK